MDSLMVVRSKGSETDQEQILNIKANHDAFGALNAN